MNRGPRRRVNGGGGNGMIYMLALHAASKFMQLPRKPPVTAALVLANTVVYLRPGPLDAVLPTVSEVCLSPKLVIKNLDAKRLLLSAFYHTDDAHLVYNMVSLLWKGLQLEAQMGSARFAGAVALLLGLSHGLIVVVAQILAKPGGFPRPLLADCSVGFSAVLFAMKIVLTCDAPPDRPTFVFGIPFPARYAAWAELVLVQVLVPEASFLGHSCGILAGLLFVLLFRRGSSSPALAWPKRLLLLLYRPISFILRPFSRSSRPRVSGRGVTGGPAGDGVWRCSVCTFHNFPTAVDCRSCGVARGARGTDDRFPSTAEDLRRVRLARFDGTR